MADTTDDSRDRAMDARLTAAGARWRDVHTDTMVTPDVEVTPAELVAPARRHHRRGLYASVAAVAAALVAGSAITVAALTHDEHRSTGTGSELTGTVWVLDGTGDSATLYVSSDGLLVADDACTVVSATVDLSVDGLAPTDIRERSRDCTDQYGPKLGDDFIEDLTHLPHVSVDGDALTIGSRHFTANPNLPVPTTDVPTFAEAKWRLIKVQDKNGRDLSVPDDIDFQVRNGQLSTSDGCNSVFGDVAIDGARVDAKLTRTQTACGPSAPVIDDVLTGSFRQSVRDNRLTIMHPGAGTLTYHWVPDDTAATDPSTLIGPTWNLATSGGERAVGSSTLRFPTSTTYEANDGCRTFTGTAVVEHGAFRLNKVPTSTPDCAKATADQATTTDSYLTSALWSVRSGRLIVTPYGAQADALVYTTSSTVASPAPSPPFAGTWTLTEVDRTQGNSASGSGSSDLGITLTISARHYGIKGLCAARSGTLTSKGGRLELNVGAEAYCVTARAPGQAVEKVFGTDGAVTWSVRGTELTLMRGGSTLTFARA